MIPLSIWRQIAYTTRLKLGELFRLNRSTFIHVSGGEVKEDGFTLEDLNELTIERLRQYVGTGNGTIEELLKLAAIKVEEPTQNNVQPTQKPEATGERAAAEAPKGDGTPVPPQKKRGRPKKQASNGGVVASDPPRM